MSFLQSPEYRLEEAISALFSGITGLNIYTTHRTGLRLFPYVTISAEKTRQLVSPYSGVYEMRVLINYSNSASKFTATQFDDQYLDVFGALYSNNLELSNKIQDNATDLKIYMARIFSQTPSIITEKDAWKRGIEVMAIVTPDETADLLYAYQFDEFENSFYLATI